METLTIYSMNKLHGPTHYKIGVKIFFELIWNLLTFFFNMNTSDVGQGSKLMSVKWRSFIFW